MTKKFSSLLRKLIVERKPLTSTHMSWSLIFTIPICLWWKTFVSITSSLKGKLDGFHQFGLNFALLQKVVIGEILSSITSSQNCFARSGERLIERDYFLMKRRYSYWWNDLLIQIRKSALNTLPIHDFWKTDFSVSLFKRIDNVWAESDQCHSEYVRFKACRIIESLSLEHKICIRLDLRWRRYIVQVYKPCNCR
jgi:hypothetical protein